jgi:hypothetical protein
MPNPIKYSTGTETLALKKGNFYIGTGAVGKGPTSETGYYNGITPPTGGYTIYLNKESGGPSIYTASNDAQLISLTNSIAGQSYTGTQQCFNYFYSQTDKLLVNQDYPVDYPYIVMDGLVVNLDASITQSYSGSGTTWADINGLGPKNNFTLMNGATINTMNGGVIYLDGTDDYVISTNDSNILGNSPRTYAGWYYIISASGAWGNLFTTGNEDCTYKMFGWARPSSGLLMTWGGCYDLSTQQELPLNTWLFIAASYDGVNYDAYVNTNTVRINRSAYNTTESKIFLGAETTNNGLSFRGRMQGYLGSFYQYNRFLSSSEISQLYNATKGRFGL